MSSSDDVTTHIDRVLQFWYGEDNEWRGGLWFRGILSDDLASLKGVQSAKDAQAVTDAYMLETFGPLIDSAVDLCSTGLCLAEGSPWTTTLQGRVALMTLLDQFTRNAYRGTSKMFAYDAIACSLARGLVADEGYRTLSPTRMLFVCVCLTHSEKLEDVNKAAVELLSIINSVDSQGSEAAMKAPRVQGAGQMRKHKDTTSKNPLVNRLLTVFKQTEAHYKILERYAP